MNRFVVVSGCSGGGKSTLLAELKRRGFAVVEEPGRRIVAEEREAGGTALPWVDLAAFARRAIALALADRAAAEATRAEAGAAGALREEGAAPAARPAPASSPAPAWVFFDRGLVDAAAALEHATGEPAIEHHCRAHRYHRRVFVTPPWPEIYGRDDDRRHGFAEAVAEHERLLRVYAELGYAIEILPKVDVASRADLVLERLNAPLA
ncbi:hypothetical protein A33M_4038 [Rhodovulum sp. PH10]|uniref:AAA family ATPase n=1 Tax=Rhodovulum sp. PH10 TaxID=1187851 RepID=UPI00027C2567|nr:AAA family ATPase [Rhodovulum sp. PH10]EJW10805.1 hypothetical protein A33M_4038 [Rhodovulum sp. PH10]